MDITLADIEPAFHEQVLQIGRVIDWHPQGKWSKKNGGIGLIYGALAGSVAGMPEFIALHVPSALFATAFGAIIGYGCDYYIFYYLQRKHRTRKLTIVEISWLLKSATDPLRKEFLDLLADLISLRPVPDKSVEDSIRSAIRDLGAAIEKLPGEPAGDLLLDSGLFEEAAARLSAEALVENDSVVAASLERQSTALSQRAEVVMQNSALARRNLMLRQEMSGHIQSLKTILGATALGDGSGEYNLTALTANIQQVTIEARSLTAAKIELETALARIG